jgi:septal ring factor EnvC (AmiA/AmiB activator)
MVIKVDKKIRDELIDVLQQQTVSFDQIKIAMADDEKKAKDQLDKITKTIENMQVVKREMTKRYAKMVEWIEELKKQ